MDFIIAYHPDTVRNYAQVKWQKSARLRTFDKLRKFEKFFYHMYLNSTKYYTN